MTRLLTEGFEMGDLIGWTNGAISSTYKRSGTYSNNVAAGNNFSNASYSPTFTTVTEGWIRFGIDVVQGYASTDNCQVQWRKGATVLGSIRFMHNQVAKVYTSTGSLVATGSIVIPQGIWVLIELHIKIDDAGTIEVKIDGVQDTLLTFSGDTKPGADTGFDNIQFYGYGSTGGSGTCNIAYDDIAVNDNVGSAPDQTWCGDGKIMKISPNGTVTNQLTGSDGNTVDNHLLVDEIPSNSDTDYVQGTVVDEEDLYDMAACGLTDVVIRRVWAESRSKDTVASGGKIALVTKAAGGSEVAGPDITLSTSYNTRVMSTEQLLNPVDSAAWEVADIDAIQAGARTRL